MHKARRITAQELAALRHTPWVTTGTMASVLHVSRKRIIRWCWDRQIVAGKLPGGQDWLINTAALKEGWAFPRQGPKVPAAALERVRALALAGGTREEWAALEQALGWSYHRIHRWRRHFEQEARDERRATVVQVAE